MSNNKKIYFFKQHYSKRLKRILKNRGYENGKEFQKQYQERFLKYMGEVDFGRNNERFSSYLNIFSGLVAYELLRENGFTQQDSIEIYDYMCKWLRKVASLAYRVVDLFPHGFRLAVNSVKEDIIGEKAVCWETSIIEDSELRFEYRITKCLYYEVCKAHGYPEFTKVFCTHDRYAYDVLHRHTKFIRYSAIGEGGECCHDAFVNNIQY